MKSLLQLLLCYLCLTAGLQAQVSFKSPINNPGFEAQPVTAPTGAIKDWVSNSLRGTGTYPLPNKTADNVQIPATPHGRQAAVIAEGGMLGTTILNRDGTPLPIVPGSKVTLSFHNIVPDGNSSSNLGAYLMADNQDGARIAEAIPVRDCDKINGRITAEFVVYSANKLDEVAPDWRSKSPFIKLHNFLGWVIIDEVEITLTAPAPAQ